MLLSVRVIAVLSADAMTGYAVVFEGAVVPCNAIALAVVLRSCGPMPAVMSSKRHWMNVMACRALLASSPAMDVTWHLENTEYEMAKCRSLPIIMYKAAPVSAVVCVTASCVSTIGA